MALAGGILILIGVFGTWAEGYLFGETSLWDGYDYVVLTSGIVVIVGVLAVWGVGMENLGALVPLGGFLALVYTMQNVRAIGDAGGNIGYAVWLVIIGSLMAIIGAFGTSALRIKIVKRR
jgi:hypothetical protein